MRHCRMAVYHKWRYFTGNKELILVCFEQTPSHPPEIGNSDDQWEENHEIAATNENKAI